MGRPLAIVALFAVAVALVFVRAPDALTAPQFWAEDATVFWLQQYQHGFPASAFQPYAGYLNVAARIVAAVASPLPYAWQPAAFVVCAAAVTGWTAATIAGLALPPLLAALLALTAVLAFPGGETLANPTNLQWVMATALPLIVATVSPAAPFARANQIAFVAVASLSGPFSVLIAPVWLWRIASGARRDRFAMTLGAITLAAALVQAVMLVATVEPAGAAADPLRALSILMVRALTEPVGSHHRPLAFAIVALALAASAVTGRFRSERRVCLAFGALVIAAVAWKFRDVPPWLGMFGGVDRYLHIPAVMIAFCAATLLFERRLAFAAGLAGCLMIAYGLSGRFVRAPIPDFSREWAEASPLIGTRPLDVPVSPSWTMRIPPR
jgi:hypothetical protein